MTTTTTSTTTVRHSIKSALIAGDVQNLSVVLFNMPEMNIEALTKMQETMVSAITQTIEARKEAIAKADAEQKELNEKRETMIKSMIAMGIPEEIATATADSTLKINAPVTRQVERVKVKFNEKEYDIPARGNLNAELKAIVQGTGMERAAFIEKYKI